MYIYISKQNNCFAYIKMCENQKGVITCIIANKKETQHMWLEIKL